MSKPGRNDPCPCGSGKKYKACCLHQQPAPAADSTTGERLLREAIALHQSGQWQRAQAHYQQILQADPDHPDALHLLGLIEHQQGRSDSALDRLARALQRRPADALFHFNLANMQQDLGRLDAAIASFEQVLRLQPGNVDALIGLGSALRGASRHDEALACYRRAIAIQPGHAQAHYNLGNALLSLNQHEQAVASFRAALRLQPGFDPAFSNLLFTLQNVPGVSQESLFAEHCEYAKRYEAPLKALWPRHGNTPEPQRRLKVGYVSGDLRQHPVAHFIAPILANHDKTCVDVFAYYNHPRHDMVTERLRACVDHWCDCHAMDDDTLAKRIRGDGIDILVDLSGHTALHRLLVFARKPAPVQVTWFGYIGTTGLSAMDYRLTNAYMDPPGLTERYHTEALVRLPGSGIAYTAAPACPPVNTLPAMSGAGVVLGSLNTLSKINPAVVKLWSRVLQALPQARLMLGNVTNETLAQRMTALFAAQGIGPERLLLQPKLPLTDYLALHHRIDLGLDPFPYNGGTTSLHALWMGVPMVTLAGQHSVARWGVAALSRVGLQDFICQSEDDYVQCVVRTVHDLPALNRIRQTLRARMSAAETAPATVTRQLEGAYRDMWRVWCARANQG